MNKKITVMVNDHPYDVELDDINASPVKVKVNGKEYSVRLEQEGTDPALVRQVPCPEPVLIQSGAAKVAASANSGNGLTAPMPGIILNIAVKAGDKVSYGQQICALEAMKMKNAIRAPREAVIASVEVTDGQKVAYGDVLVKFA